jgi:hypothetical protein
MDTIAEINQKSAWDILLSLRALQGADSTVPSANDARQWPEPKDEPDPRIKEACISDWITVKGFRLFTGCGIMRSPYFVQILVDTQGSICVCNTDEVRLLCLSKGYVFFQYRTNGAGVLVPKRDVRSLRTFDTRIPLPGILGSKNRAQTSQYLEEFVANHRASNIEFYAHICDAIANATRACMISPLQLPFAVQHTLLRDFFFMGVEIRSTLQSPDDEFLQFEIAGSVQTG